MPEDETSPRPAIWTPEVTLIPRGEVLYLKVGISCALIEALVQIDIVGISQVRFATYRAAVLASRGGSGEGSAAEVILIGKPDIYMGCSHSGEKTGTRFPPFFGKKIRKILFLTTLEKSQNIQKNSLNS